VPSRRLGLSLGIDIVPLKFCTLDCVYCQLGKTAETVIERKEYGIIEPILAELKEALAGGIKADYITIAGSGEPTLNSRLGELIDKLRDVTNIPIAILTNGTLLYREDVRADCAKANVVMPSLDAGDEQTFQRINRPNDVFSIEKLISGLCAFRKEFIGHINPDKVHLNTAVRPTADPNIVRLSAEKLHDIAYKLGPKCEVVADFSPANSCKLNESKSENTLGFYSAINRKAEALLSMLKRRPCSLNDICAGLNVNRNEATKYIGYLQNRGVIQSELKDGIVFFKTSS